MPPLATLRRAYLAWATLLLLAVTAAVMPTAAQALEIPGASRPGSDVDGDAKDDLVWLQSAATNTAYVLKSNGTSFPGSAQWATNVSIPDWSATGDFNGDGKIDLASYDVAGGAAGQVRVRLSNGSAFGASSAWVTGLERPDWVGVGDFNGDTRDDIAWYNATGPNAQRVHVFLSNGSSGFALAGAWITGIGLPEWAGVGDFNADGKDDVALYTKAGGTVHVLRSTGAAFAYAGQWKTGVVRPDWASTGDLNDDGRDDLIVASGGATVTIKTFVSSGTGFANGVDWASGVTRPEFAAVGDYTGDGKDDLAWYRGGQFPSGNANVLRNTGSAFAAPAAWATGLGRPAWLGNGSTSIQTNGRGADFNQDGLDDLAWYHKENTQAISVIRSNGSSFPDASAWRTGMGNPDWAGAGDFDGDGKEDLAWYHKENVQAVSVALSNGGSFPDSTVWRTGMGNPDWAGVGDFNGDGKDDLAWYHKENGGGVSVALSNGSSFYTASVWRPGMNNPDWAGVGDFNGDGRDDLAWYHTGGTQAVSVALSDGSSFPDSQPWRTGLGLPDWAGVGDFTGDGRDDLAWYHKEGIQAVSVLASSGTDFPTSNVWRTGLGLPDWALVGSFNGDGKDDLAWYHKENSQAVSVLQSDGGSFPGASVWRTGLGNPDWAFPGEISRAYRSSWRFGAANHRVDTQWEADAVIDELRNSSESLAGAIYNELSPADQTYVVARMDSKWPSSRTYGGGNWKVDSDSEAGTFVGQFLHGTPAIQDTMLAQLGSEAERTFVREAAGRIYSPNPNTESFVDAGTTYGTPYDVPAEDRAELGLTGNEEPVATAAAAGRFPASGCRDVHSKLKLVWYKDRKWDIDYAETAGYSHMKIVFCWNRANWSARAKTNRRSSWKGSWFEFEDGWGKLGYATYYGGGNDLKWAFRDLTFPTAYRDTAGNAVSETSYNGVNATDVRFSQRFWVVQFKSVATTIGGEASAGGVGVSGSETSTTQGADIKWKGFHVIRGKFSGTTETALHRLND